MPKTCSASRAVRPPGPSAVPSSSQREVRGRDVAADLVDVIDDVVSEHHSVSPYRVLVRGVVDTEGLHVSLTVDDDVAVLPDDQFRKLLRRELLGSPPDVLHHL